MILKFGKYKNKSIDDVPPQYLEWMLATIADLDPRLRRAIIDHLARTDRHDGPTATASSGPPLVAIPEVARAIKDGLKEVRRELAQKYHPDHGGSNEAMIALNDFYERLTPALLGRICMIPPVTTGRHDCKAIARPGPTTPTRGRRRGQPRATVHVTKGLIPRPPSRRNGAKLR